MRSFLDTNILVYADAGDEPIKQERALSLIGEHRLARFGVISTQVLQAFTHAALCKLGLPPPWRGSARAFTRALTSSDDARTPSICTRCAPSRSTTR